MFTWVISTKYYKIENRIKFFGLDSKNSREWLSMTGINIDNKELVLLLLLIVVILTLLSLFSH